MPIYRKRHKRGTWKGTRCWFVVLHLVAFIISSLSYTNTKSIFSKPKLLNCWIRLQNPTLLTVWRLYKCFPLFKIHIFFSSDTHWIFVGYHTIQVKEKKGGEEFFESGMFFLVGISIFLEMFSFFVDGWKFSLNKLPYKYVVNFLSMLNA